ncbi:MAG: DUF4197 domain-containing protein [Blastocatellia bacterium]
MKLRIIILSCILLSLFSAAEAQTRTRKPATQAAASEDKIITGLKEALRIGTDNAVTKTGRLDGYFKNLAIKILMPKKLQTFEKGLRVAGFGPQVDEFVLSMNRAAEKAAPQAARIFVDAIKQMTFNDARQILTGGDTAATNYFKSKTSAQLSTAFRPIIEKSMNEVGATRQYKDLVGRYQNIPFASSLAVDIDEYVTTAAINGLFYMIGEEEKKIRKDPMARVTSILKDVFGR